MNQTPSILSRAGQLLSVVTIAAISLTGFSQAEDREFFEKKYKKKLTTVKRSRANAFY